MKKEMTSLKLLSIVVLGTIMLPTASLAAVYNDSDESVYVKPEHSNDPVEVKKGHEYKGPQDGVASKGKVYKNIDGSDVKVDKKGDVKVIQKNPVRLLAEEVRGGNLDKSPDSTWDPVFNKAKQQKKDEQAKAKATLDEEKIEGQSLTKADIK
ncbi:hypothetical protein F9817_12225 [Vibrio sp. CAIM 722]|uniref:Uncharacterized protein n=1 Tax=Vibrio eleionomae TaxID=2653505 RepID=A0A7X4LL91_9VIBR|nr:hypothetical protein [Vibrio eleionomae]MZI93959.1 hypothetical protein [Vibrio eleionomae]